MFEIVREILQSPFQEPHPVYLISGRDTERIYVVDMDKWGAPWRV